MGAVLAVGRRRSQGGIDVGSPCERRGDREQQLGGFDRLQDDTVNASGQESPDRRRVSLARVDDEGCLGGDLRGGARDIEARHVGQAKIDDTEVRLMLLEQPDRVGAGACPTDDHEALVLEKRSERRDDRFVVIDEYAPATRLRCAACCPHAFIVAPSDPGGDRLFRPPSILVS
jgi:hypothetical protein